MVKWRNYEEQSVGSCMLSRGEIWGLSVSNVRMLGKTIMNMLRKLTCLQEVVDFDRNDTKPTNEMQIQTIQYNRISIRYCIENNFTFLWACAVSIKELVNRNLAVEENVRKTWMNAIKIIFGDWICLEKMPRNVDKDYLWRTTGKYG